MLVQLPRGSAEAPKGSSAEECSAFEAALRRDLATAPVVPYDPILGGWRKRAFDVALTLVTFPVWLPTMLVVAARAKLKHSAPVFISEERIGYGGRAFAMRRLRIEPPTAVIAQLHPGKHDEVIPANDLGTLATGAEDGRAKWGRFFERLPQLFNVLAGDMSLVGPEPLVHDDIEQLKTGKRYYLSSRPGVAGISALIESDQPDGSQYKAYTLSWSNLLDVLLLWDAVRGFRNRGELWKPSSKLKKPRARAEGEVAPRRRSREA